MLCKILAAAVAVAVVVEEFAAENDRGWVKAGVEEEEEEEESGGISWSFSIFLGLQGGEAGLVLGLTHVHKE